MLERGIQLKIESSCARVVTAVSVRSKSEALGMQLSPAVEGENTHLAAWNKSRLSGGCRSVFAMNVELVVVRVFGDQPSTEAKVLCRRGFREAYYTGIAILCRCFGGMEIKSCETGVSVVCYGEVLLTDRRILWTFAPVELISMKQGVLLRTASDCKVVRLRLPNESPAGIIARHGYRDGAKNVHDEFRGR